MGLRLLVLFLIAKFWRTVENSPDLTQDDKTLIFGITSLFMFVYIIWWAWDAWRKAVKRATERAIERAIVERAIELAALERAIEEMQKEKEKGERGETSKNENPRPKDGDES
jgi:type VI protein secretion system component VasK